MSVMTAKYSKEWLISQVDGCRSFDYLLFYGHKVSTDGSATASCCSQWFRAQFELGGQVYLTAEHYMMAEKARLFGDSDIGDTVPGSDTAFASGAFVCTRLFVQTLTNTGHIPTAADLSQNGYSVPQTFSGDANGVTFGPPSPPDNDGVSSLSKLGYLFYPCDGTAPTTGSTLNFGQ